MWDAATGACERVHWAGDPDHHMFQQALDTSEDVESVVIRNGSSVSLPVTDVFVCESKVSFTCVAASGIVFVFCDSGRLHALRLVSAAPANE